MAKKIIFKEYNKIFYHLRNTKTNKRVENKKQKQKVKAKTINKINLFVFENFDKKSLTTTDRRHIFFITINVVKFRA